MASKTARISLCHLLETDIGGEIISTPPAACYFLSRQQNGGDLTPVASVGRDCQPVFLKTRVTNNLPPRVVAQGIVDTRCEGSLDGVALLHLFDESRSCGRHCVRKIKVPLLPKGRQQGAAVPGTDDIVLDRPFDFDKDFNLNSKDGPRGRVASSLRASLGASAAAHVDGWMVRG